MSVFLFAIMIISNSSPLSSQVYCPKQKYGWCHSSTKSLWCTCHSQSHSSSCLKLLLWRNLLGSKELECGGSSWGLLMPQLSWNISLTWKVLFICFVTCIKDFIDDKWLKTAWEPGLPARAHTSEAQNLSLLIHSPVLPTGDTPGTDEGSLCMPCHFVLFRLCVCWSLDPCLSPHFSVLFEASAHVHPSQAGLLKVLSWVNIVGVWFFSPAW